MKLDGDIEMAPDYLRRLMERFDADPRLGLAGGVLDEPTAEGGMRRIQIPRVHVHGALKCYTRDCFEAIGGVQERLGWDTIDETYARMRGFTVWSFTDLVSVHHRPLGQRGRDRCAAARATASARTSPTSRCRGSRCGRSRSARRRPMALSGLAFFYGYVRAAARRVERVPDPEYRRFTHRELRRRMLGALVPHHQGAR